MKELLSGNNLADQSPEIQANLQDLLEKVNKIRELWAHSMTVTSGLRSMEHHLEIYKAKGITDKSKIPMKSKHLYGEAVDISDPKQELQEWCKANEDKIREIGLWMESFAATKNWVHFQIKPYGSYKEGGSLWFNP